MGEYVFNDTFKTNPEHNQNKYGRHGKDFGYSVKSNTELLFLVHFQSYCCDMTLLTLSPRPSSDK